MSKKTKKDSELQGISHLLVDATIGITDLVEDMHKQIVHPSFLPATLIQKLITTIAGITYQNIRWSALFIGKSLHKILEQLTPTIGQIKASDKKEIILSVLNGVIGDYLEEKENPLKIEMQFRYRLKSILLDRKSLKATYPNVNGKILLMLHGSCMNDIQWTRKEHNHGNIIAKELNKTPIYLNYNSGRHISTNGKNLNDGLKLNSTYITNILKCVPPKDKPLNKELLNCSNYFNNELKNLKHLKVIITLGKVAFDNCIKNYKKNYEISIKYKFKHGEEYILPDNRILISCYHPSPRNVNTKIINLRMLNRLFVKAKKLAKI